MAKITPLSLYLINRIKFRRLVLGISSWYFATLIEKSESFIYKIEDPDVQAQYNTHDYPAIAKALKWTIEDLLPPDNWPVGDGTKVEKKVLSLSNPDDMRLVLNGMIDNGFFNEPKSLIDTAKHLYIDGKEEEKALKVVLGELAEAGRLLKGNAQEYTKA